MESAINTFNTQGSQTSDGHLVQVESQAEGSVDTVDRILRGVGTPKPTAWCPASTLEVNLLATQWNAMLSIIPQSGELRPRSLVSSPLVFAVFANRFTDLFGGHAIDWNSLSSLMQKHQVRFGHTRPDESNSGLLTLILLAYSYFHETSRLKPEPVLSDKGFQEYLDRFERGVTKFGHSSGTFLQQCVTEDVFDVVTTYENLVLVDQQRRFQMFYPSPNLLSDHPFVILQGPWVTPEEQEAARLFRDFLLSAEQQQHALAYGFRPTTESRSAKVRITDNIPDNRFLPFLKSNARGFQADIPDSAQYPAGPVVRALIQVWTNSYGSSATCQG